MQLESANGSFDRVCSAGVLFLIDTTGSMGSYMNAAKEQVKSIMKDIKEVFMNRADVRMAVAGYKDYGDRDAIQFLDFVTSADQVHAFLNTLAPPHGGALNDMPSNDHYPVPGSQPHGLTHEPLLEQMVARNINYALLRINDTTDRMALVFSQA